MSDYYEDNELVIVIHPAQIDMFRSDPEFRPWYQSGIGYIYKSEIGQFNINNSHFPGRRVRICVNLKVPCSLS